MASLKLVIKNSLYIGKTDVLSWEEIDTLWYNKFLLSRAVLVRKSISWQTCMCYKICPQYVTVYAFCQFCWKGRHNFYILVNTKLQKNFRPSYLVPLHFVLVCTVILCMFSLYFWLLVFLVILCNSVITLQFLVTRDQVA